MTDRKVSRAAQDLREAIAARAAHATVAVTLDRLVRERRKALRDAQAQLQHESPKP